MTGLADAIEQLMIAEASTNLDVRQWQDIAGTLGKAFDGELPNRVPFPHVLRHYLIDIDIRLKSPDYARVQRAQMARLIDSLRLGRLPTDSELTV
mgnify:FL=1